MKNEVAMKPFPENLFDDLGHKTPVETPGDFTATLMYVLHSVAPARDVQIALMRYRDGKAFEDIAQEMNITRQRVFAIIQEILGRITGNHADMLYYGMKQYMENILADRVESIACSIDSAEREAIRSEAYAKGLSDGKAEIKPQVSDAFEDVLIEHMGLSARTYNACVRNDLRNLADILNIGDGIMNCRSFGVRCFHELCSVLESMSIDALIYFPHTIEKIGMED